MIGLIKTTGSVYVFTRSRLMGGVYLPLKSMHDPEEWDNFGTSVSLRRHDWRERKDDNDKEVPDQCTCLLVRALLECLK